MSQDWNLSSRGHACLASGASFEDGMTICSRLVFGEGGYVREDYRQEAWDDALREGALSVWKGVYRAPPPRKAEPLRKENAEALLRELIETEDERNRNVIFILAVMLERKRAFLERDVAVREDGVKIRIYEHRGTGEMFAIPDPELKLSEIENVQQEVFLKLGGESPVGESQGGAEAAAEAPEPEAGSAPEA